MMDDLAPRIRRCRMTRHRVTLGPPQIQPPFATVETSFGSLFRTLETKPQHSDTLSDVDWHERMQMLVVDPHTPSIRLLHTVRRRQHSDQLWDRSGECVPGAVYHDFDHPRPHRLSSVVKYEASSPSAARQRICGWSNGVDGLERYNVRGLVQTYSLLTSLVLTMLNHVCS